MSNIANNLLAEVEKKMANLENNQPVIVTEDFETHVSVPVEATEEIVADPTPLDQMTISSLDAILNNLQECGDFSENLAVPKRAGSFRPTKQDKIAAIEKIKASNAGLPTLAERTFTYETLSLAEVCINPDNYRTAMDYIDRELYLSVKMAGKTGIKDIVLSAQKVMCEDGVERYPAIAGNRTLSQHFQICDNDGDDYEDYKLTFKMISYDDSKNMADIQALRDLVKDNQGSLKPSKIDLARTAQKFMRTMTVKNAAKEVGLHASELSRLNRILTLPEEILRHVEIQEKADHYANALSKKQLENFGVSFYSEFKEGQEVVKVCGVSLSNAQVLANHLHDVKQGGDATKIATFMDFLGSQELIQAAQTLSTKDLTKWLLTQDTMRLVGLSNLTQQEPTEAADVISQALNAPKQPAPEPEELKSPKSTARNAEQIAAEKMSAAKRTFRSDCGIEYDDFISSLMDLKFKPIDMLDAEVANMAFKQRDDKQFLELCHLMLMFGLLVPA